MNTFKVGLLGCGNIAGGTVRLLNDNRERVESSAGRKIEITRVYARTREKAYVLGFSPEKIADSADEVIFSEDVDCVLELMGGVDLAFECAKKALSLKKPLVTANKDMMSARWNELFSAAVDAGAFLGFEASVGGGIPIIGPLCGTLCCNEFNSVCGILNGTTNFILSSMEKTGCSYGEALKTAQQLGYAEADPTSDVSGLDAARKLSVTAALAFGRHFNVGDIALEGIDGISEKDLHAAEAVGCVLKLIARADRVGDGITLSVRPCAVKKDHPLASVEDSFNALYADASPLGGVMLYGRGAGAGPTSSSVAGDLIRAARGERTRDLRCNSAAPCDDGEFISGFLIRLSSSQRGLGALLTSLERRGITFQKAFGDDGMTVVTTGRARQRDIDDSVRELFSVPDIKEIRHMRILER